MDEYIGAEQYQKQNKVLLLPIDNIRINKNNPRKVLCTQSLEGLSRSIKTIGVLQPIQVRHISPTEYILVSGERRLKAAKMAGFTVIPSIVSEIKDDEYAINSLIDNIHRERLNYFEEANAYDRLIRDGNLTQEQLAYWIGKSQATIANKIRLLKLSPTVKKMLIDYNLSERHARMLLRINDEQLRIRVLDKICRNNLNVREAEELIDKLISRMLEQTEMKKPGVRTKRIVKDIRMFINTIKEAVELMKKSGIAAKAARVDRGDFIDIMIRIPKP